jgi:hypothetical protein
MMRMESNIESVFLGDASLAFSIGARPSGLRFPGEFAATSFDEIVEPYADCRSGGLIKTNNILISLIKLFGTFIV